MYDSSSKFTLCENGRITPDPYVSVNELLSVIDNLRPRGIRLDGGVLANLLLSLTWYVADGLKGGGAE